MRRKYNGADGGRQAQRIPIAASMTVKVTESVFAHYSQVNSFSYWLRWEKCSYCHVFGISISENHHDSCDTAADGESTQ